LEFNRKNKKEMDILINLISAINLFGLVYFSGAGLYFLLFAIASRFYKEKKTVKHIAERAKAAVIIPAYKEDGVILDTAKAMVNHTCYSCDYDVWVVADSLKPETIIALSQLPISLLPVDFEKSTKSKAIRLCLGQLKSDYDYAIILDADNIPAPGFVDQLIQQLNAGFLVVQGHRTAKNSNTTLAVLDGISEEVNNAIFRKGHRALGLSASLIGSAFAFDFHLFRSMMNESKAVGGFDKELELMLAERGITIGYAQNAIVYDEKTQQSDVFIQQRTRWLSAQINYLTQSLKKGWLKLVVDGNADYADKILQFLVPPRILALGIPLLMTITGLLLSAFMAFSPIYPLVWSLTFLTIATAIAVALPYGKFSGSLLKIIINLPHTFMLMILALFRTKGANKQFIHTQHGIKQ